MLDQNQLSKSFGGKIRIRVGGLLVEKSKILLLKHQNLGPDGYLWLPPGGGVEFGESLIDALKKEFLEETNLTIEVGKYLFANEFINDPYHAIELFFEVKRVSGTLKLGYDPELPKNQQILTEAKFFSPEEIELIPDAAIHNAFNAAGERHKITDLRGLFTFKH